MRFIGVFLFSLSLAAANPVGSIPTLRIMIDQGPLNLNPRQTLDATGQRIGSLVFRGLSKLDLLLQPQDDLGIRWRSSNSFREWSFEMAPQVTDILNQPIAASDLLECLENYRTGQPSSVIGLEFEGWYKTTLRQNRITVFLNKPDPYFKRNASLLRFFRSTHKSNCSEPDSQSTLVASGSYQLKQESTQKISLQPRDSTLPILQINIVKDEATRVLKILNHEVDITQNALSSHKTRWLKENSKKDLRFFERPGVNVSYLAFNLREGAIQDVRVRRAIAHAINREEIIRYRLQEFAILAGSFLAPALPESAQFSIDYSPSESIRLLNAAGLRSDANGVRLKLRYRTTTQKEGYETALIFKDMLKKVGIELQIDQVEPAVFFSGLKTSHAHLYVSRWVGVSDGSIFNRTLATKESLNRVGFSNLRVDQILQDLQATDELKSRLKLLHEIQKVMSEELPYFPLWFWNTSMIIHKTWATRLTHDQLSLSGSYEIFTKLLKSEDK